MIPRMILLLIMFVAIFFFGIYMIYIGNEIQSRNEEIYKLLKKSVEDIDRHVYYFTRDFK